MAFVLSLRTLNRRLIERQLLRRRTSRSALDVIKHLVALQGQEPNWPYLGLWTRLKNFRRGELTTLFHDRSVVRSTVLRRTQHLISSEDFSWLRPTVQPIVSSALQHAYCASKIGGLDLEALARVGRELLADRVLSRQELAQLLGERFPDRHGKRLADAVELLLPLVHPPPAGLWGAWGTRGAISVARADTWTGLPMGSPQVEELIRRYLMVFGPASVKDVQAWSGLTRLGDVVEGLRASLRVFHDEQGRELFDVPDAPIADEDLPVPVRFLPAFDNLVLGHADRSRIISREDRQRVAPGQAMVHPTFLVNGFVQGIWTAKNTILQVTPFRPLSEVDAEALFLEAKRLLSFIADDSSQWKIALSRGKNSSRRTPPRSPPGT